MSELQWLGLIVVALYLAAAVFSRMHFIARSSLQALLGRLDEIEATARMRGAKDEDQIIKLLKVASGYALEANKPRSRLFSTGAIENRGWITAHYCELLLLSLPGYNKNYLYGMLRRESAELAKLPPDEGKAWRVLIDRHVDQAGVRRDGSDPSEAEADLSQLLSRSHRFSDAYHNSLAELYNKSVWLIMTGLLFVAAVIVAMPDAVPLLGAGAIGGLASRILRISTASSMPTDYGALWVPLFLSPVLGALLGWAGILLLSLGRSLDIIALPKVDLADERSASVLALALVFGFTERFFNGVANLVANKVLGTQTDKPAAAAEEALLAERVPPAARLASSGPVVSTEQVDSTQPGAPAETGGPTGPTVPTEPVVSAEPGRPADAGEPTDPNVPTEPVDSTQPDAPAETGGPTRPSVSTNEDAQATQSPPPEASPN